jgi:hypothetical protein
MPIDEKSVDVLREAKSGHEVFFALVVKSPAVGAMVLNKSSHVPQPQINKAKQECDGTTVVKGRCHGENDTLYFVTVKEVDSSAKSLTKKLVKEAGFMQHCEFTTNGEAETEKPIKTRPPTTGVTGGTTTGEDPRAAQLRQRLIKIAQWLTQAKTKEEMQGTVQRGTPIAQEARDALSLGRLEDAEQKIKLLENYLKIEDWTAPPTSTTKEKPKSPPPDSKGQELMKRLAVIVNWVKEKKGEPSMASTVERVSTVARDIGEALRNGNLTEAENKLTTIEKYLNLGPITGVQPPPRPTTPPPRPRTPPPLRPLKPLPPRPEQMQHAIDNKLLTFEDLVRDIGHAPKKDKLGGKWKMSKKYKKIEIESKTLSESLGGLGGQSLSKFDKSQAEQVNANLDRLITSCQAYAKQHSKDSQKVAAANRIIKNAQGYKQALQNITTDPGFEQVKHQITVIDALEIKRRGIPFRDCHFETFNDGKVNREQSKENFGSGLANTVSKLVYTDGRARIFKKEPETDTSPLDGPNRIGVDKNAPHYGNRNVASHSIAKFLDNKSIGECRFAMHDGNVGLLMEMAPGKTPRQTVEKPIAPDNALLKNAILLKQEEKQGYWQDEEGNWFRSVKEIVNPWGDKTPTEDEVAQLQQQLSELEFCDMLTGQIDRHAENYLIEVKDGKVKVTGIDNDLCFGPKQGRIESKDVNDAYRGTGAPRLIDRKTYDRLVNGDFDRDMKPSLIGLLNEEEINASRTRFDLVKQHALAMEEQKCVVDDWKTWRSKDGLTATQFLSQGGHKPTSIFQRDLAKFIN